MGPLTLFVRFKTWILCKCCITVEVEEETDDVTVSIKKT